MMRLWLQRRLVLTLTLCLVTLLFAAVVVRTWSLATESGITALPSIPVPTSVPSPPTHAIYLFQLDGFPADPLHPGQHLTLRWAPNLVDAASSSRATDVICRLAFYGPYASQADADQQASHLAPLDPAAWPPAAFATEPRIISDQIAESQPVLLVLPTTLRPGIYLVMYQATNIVDGIGIGGSFFVRLTA